MVLTAHRPSRWTTPPWRSLAAPVGLVEFMMPGLEAGEKLEIFEVVVAGCIKSKEIAQETETWLVHHGPPTVGEYILFCRTLRLLGSEARRIDSRVLRKAARVSKNARDDLVARRRLDPTAEFHIIGASSSTTRRFRLTDCR